MTPPEDNFCPRCGKEIKSSGTLTQWILGCQCGLEVNDTGPSEKQQPVLGREFAICLNCGKRIEAGRPGSLTQWVFRADICSCSSGQQVPSSTHVLPDTQQNQALPGDAQETTGTELPEFDLNELPQSDLQVSSTRFPAERYAAKLELGKGSTGTVYLASDRLLNKAVAVKCLNILTDEEMVAFQREAKATSRLEHPNIIKVMDFGATDAGSPYMVMEYFPGISLEKYLEQNGRLDAPFVLVLFMQVADCLAYAHKQGIFHRDIKPSNILLSKLDPTRSIKLIDFGVAQVKAKDQEPTVYQGRNILGTPRYMAPDQLIGAEYDERSEVYSLGCVLFECLVGQPPFDGETALDTIYKQVNEAPPLAELDSGNRVPEKLQNLISSMLEKKPSLRPSDMTAVHQSLKAILEPEESPVNKERPASSRNQRIAMVALITIAIAAACFFTVSYMTPKPAVEIKPKTKTEEELVQETARKFFVDSFEFGDIHTKMLQPLSNLDKPISDADLQYLAKSELPLKQITLAHSEITGDGLVYLLDSGVHTIDLSSRNLTKKAFQYLSQMKTLKRIALDNTNIDDEDLSLLAKNLAPHSIYLRVCSNITDKGISALGNHPNLHKIDLEGTALTDKGLLALSTCTDLTDIFFNKTSITDAGIKSLSTLKKLQGLSIGECTALTDQVIPLVCKNLNTISLYVTGICSSAIQPSFAAFLTAQLPADLPKHCFSM